MNAQTAAPIEDPRISDIEAPIENPHPEIGLVDISPKVEAQAGQTAVATGHIANHSAHILPKPSRLRLAVLLIAAICPLITSLLYILTPLTNGWDTWHRTLVITPIMVLSIVFIVTPAIQRHFGWYVTRMPRRRRSQQ